MLKMNQSAQGNNPDTSANIQEKRKRGHPRKYPKIIPENNARVPKIQGIENVGGPPVFGGVNGNQPRPVAVASVDTNNFMVGKAVSGKIEAVFDSGYFLSVRVADSDTTLWGVVFKPGRFVPISAENDVAPNLQMIRRNEILIPTEHHNPRPGERKEQQANLHRDRAAYSFSESPVANQVPRVGSYPANNLTSKGKPVPSVAVQTAQSSPAVSRGNLVPVVLEPPKLSNGLPVTSEPTPIATEASHLPASKGKQVQEAANKSNGSTPTTEVPKYASEANFSQLQANHHLVSELYPNEIDPCNQPSTEKLLAAEAVSMRLPDVPLHKLVTDVFKRVEVPSDLTNSPSGDGKLGSKTLVQDENRPDDVNQALAIEPLQTVQPNESNPASAPKSVENDKTSKMSQLLEEMFIIDLDAADDLMRRVIIRDAGKCYRNWKSDLFDYFKKTGGVDNISHVRRHPSKNIKDNSHWDPTCDLFTSTRFQQRSATNYANRAQQKVKSYHGRSLILQHRHKKAISAIDTWGDLHHTRGKWTCPEVEETWNRMVEERITQLSQSASNTTPTIVVEENIPNQVLGVHRRHKKGVGSTIPHTECPYGSSSSSSQSDNGTASSFPPQATDYLSRLYNQQMQMYQMLQQIRPNFRLDDMVPPPADVFGAPPPRAADPQQGQQNDDDDDGVGAGSNYAHL